MHSSASHVPAALEPVTNAKQPVIDVGPETQTVHLPFKASHLRATLQAVTAVKLSLVSDLRPPPLISRAGRLLESTEHL